MRDKTPKLGLLLKRLLESVKNVEQAIKKQTNAASSARDEERQQQQPPPEVRAEIHFPDNIERANSERKKKEYSLQKANVIAAYLTVGIVTIYAGISFLQLEGIREANKIGREANIVSQRAFVFIPGDYDVISGSLAKTKEKSWLFSFKMKNSGNTPATINGDYVNSNGSYNATYEPLPSNFEFPDNPGGGPFPNTITKVARTVIAPHEEWGLSGLTIQDSVFERVNKGEAHVYFWGWVSYSDVFGCPHRTEFAREVVSAQKTTSGGRAFFMGNLPEHNCIDKDCKDYQPTNNPNCPN